MSRWNPMGLLRMAAPSRAAGRDMAVRWARAFRADPELADDVIRLGRLFEARPARYEAGVEAPDPIDPMRLAYEAGARDLALQLLAAGNLDHRELSALMEDGRE